MKKFISLTLLFALVLAFNGVAFCGDMGEYKSLQKVEPFFNNSGGTLSGGDVVILDTAGSGVTVGTTLGRYVTTTTSADSVLAIGVVQEGFTSADQTPVFVVTSGPVDTRILDGTDAVTINTAVGTATTAKKVGGGTNLGIALEAGSGNDNDLIIVWVDPTGAD